MVEEGPSTRSERRRALRDLRRAAGEDLPHTACAGSAEGLLGTCSERRQGEETIVAQVEHGGPTGHSPFHSSDRGCAPTTRTEDLWGHGRSALDEWLHLVLLSCLLHYL